MIIYDVSLQSPFENIVCDEMLLQRAEKTDGEDVLRLWESPVLCVVLGLGGKAEEDVKIDSCRRDHVEILRRSSGGGTVLLGRGCLNFSFIYSLQKNPVLKDLHRSYHAVLDPVIIMLKQLRVEVKVQPISDLALVQNNKKVSGNAQRRMRKYILHHGTLLYDFDLGCLERYLTIPRKIPEYRAGRVHLDFVDNLDLDVREIRARFLTHFQRSSVVDRLSQEEMDDLRTILSVDRFRFK